MSLIKKAGQVVLSATAVIEIARRVGKVTKDPETGVWNQFTVLGVDVFDRRRMDARQARRAARKKKDGT